MLQADRLNAQIQVDYQRQLEESERRFRSLVRYGSDMMVILDSSGNYLYVTDPSKRVLGYSAGIFLGKNALDFLHPDDGPAILSLILNLAPDAYLELPPFRFRAANGEWRWLESKVVNLIGDPAVGGLVINSRDVTEKRRIEAQRELELEKRQKLVTRAIVKAQEAERHSIGNELHDNVNQLLTTVKLYLVMAKEKADIREELLTKAIGYIQDSIDEIRKLSNRLVSPHHPDLELSEAVGELIGSIAMSGALKLSYETGQMDDLEISEEIQLVVYRIVQEQLTNIIRHANASEVNVRLEQSRDELVLVIADNGRGFDIEQVKKGVGLLNMYNRAETVGGTLDITSFPGEGCTLVGKFPLL